MKRNSYTPVSSSQWFALGVLSLVYMLHTVDRNIVSAVVEPIKREFTLTDRAMGALSGLAHAVAFAVAVLPMGWGVDRMNRIRLLAGLLAVWSGMTALSGLAGSYWGLLLARSGVGAAEAGSSPACMSLISDLFPPSRRASAIGMFYLSTAFGTGLVFLVGAAVAHNFGWRTMFFAAGLPGLMLAALLLMVLSEPKRGGFESAPAPSQGVSFAAVWRHVQAHRSVTLLTLAIMMAAMLMSSLWTWTASFLIRLHGLDLQRAGLIVALVAGVAQAIGSAVAGPVADRLAHGMPSRLAIVPTVMLICAVAAGLGMVLVPELHWTLACALLMGFMLGGWLGPGYGLLMTLTPAPMRGRVMAGSQLMTNLIGVGLGPLLTGALSDLIGGPGSLRWAMALTLLIGLVAALLFWASGRQAERDLRQIA